MILSEYQKTKTFLLKDILKIGQKKIVLLAKLKNTVPFTYVISHLNHMVELFMNKNWKKQSKNNSE